MNKLVCIGCMDCIIFIIPTKQKTPQYFFLFNNHNLKKKPQDLALPVLPLILPFIASIHCYTPHFVGFGFPWFLCALLFISNYKPQSRTGC